MHSVSSLNRDAKIKYYEWKVDSWFFYRLVSNFKYKCTNTSEFYEHSSWLFLTQRATFLLNSGYDSLHSLAASTLAGDSSFGSASIDITEIKIVSTVCTGNQRSEAFSYPHLSSPGSCSIEIHTSPFFSILGCQISVTNFIRGGRSGYSLGKYKWALKNPPSL